MNVIEACIDRKVKRVVALSTDKASSPINLYGATKLASDKMFIASNSSYAGGHSTRMSVVRYGNVMGSRGSVIPFFMSLPENSNFPITDVRMTRFMMDLYQGVELVWTALEDMVGGEIYVKKIPSMKVVDIAKSISNSEDYKIIGIRPGEKLHEEMISTNEARYTYEYDSYYKILPSIYGWDRDEERIKNGIRVEPEFKYSSDGNTNWMKPEELRAWIKMDSNEIGKI
jgi:UDP-N-acetylglucosamine 4,6-dehydratase/5-epimerase